jgi:hypothetical protein
LAKMTKWFVLLRLSPARIESDYTTNKVSNKENIFHFVLKITFSENMRRNKKMKFLKCNFLLTSSVSFLHLSNVYLVTKSSKEFSLFVFLIVLNRKKDASKNALLTKNLP